MGMTNEEINAMIANGPMPESSEKVKPKKSAKKVKEATEPVIVEDGTEESSFLISQEDVDSVLALFVADDDNSSNKKQSLIEEIHSAILDSGKLTLGQWVNLRKRLSEIEVLIPHIDLIIRLKSKKEKVALE